MCLKRAEQSLGSCWLTAGLTDLAILSECNAKHCISTLLLLAQILAETRSAMKNVYYTWSCSARTKKKPGRSSVGRQRGLETSINIAHTAGCNRFRRQYSRIVVVHGAMINITGEIADCCCSFTSYSRRCHRANRQSLRCPLQPHKSASTRIFALHLLMTAFATVELL